MIRIGDKNYEARAPQDLDERLMAATGISAAEMATMIAGAPEAAPVARALHPFLHGDVPAVQQLAIDIRAAGVENVAPQVRALYASRDRVAAPAKSKGAA
jgi:hypothetical protein